MKVTEEAIKEACMEGELPFVEGYLAVKKVRLGRPGWALSEDQEKGRAMYRSAYRRARENALARERGILPSMSEMANSLVGSQSCRRGLHFTDAAWPSQAAIHHLDVSASVIHEFCIKNLNLYGREWRDSCAENDERKRKRDESENRSSSSSSRSRPRFR